MGEISHRMLLSEHSFGALLQATQSDVLAFVRHLVGNPDDAHDVAQDVYVRAWRAAQRKDTQACFAAAGNAWSAPDGAIWFRAGCDLERLTLIYNGYSTYGTPSYQLFPAPTALDPNAGLVLAPMADGSVWFVGQSVDEIGRLT